jgi:vacuolar-type H+-ATPase subunit E/Vma4
MAATVRMHPEDQAMFAGIVRELNGTRTAAQEIVIDNERPLETRGGFILEGSDYDVDQTLDTLFQDLRHDLAAEIAADLFQNDAGSSTS